MVLHKPLLSEGRGKMSYRRGALTPRKQHKHFWKHSPTKGWLVPRPGPAFKLTSGIRHPHQPTATLTCGKDRGDALAGAHLRLSHRATAPGKSLGKGRGFKAIFKPEKVELSRRSPLGTEFNRPSHSQK